MSVRNNGFNTHYMCRDVVDVVEQAGERLDLIMVPKVGAASPLQRRRGVIDPDPGYAVGCALCGLTALSSRQSCTSLTSIWAARRSVARMRSTAGMPIMPQSSKALSKV